VSYERRLIVTLVFEYKSTVALSFCFLVPVPYSLFPVFCYQGLASAKPQSARHLSGNQIRGEAALKPIVRSGCLYIAHAMPTASRCESNPAMRIGDRVSIKKISKGQIGVSEYRSRAIASLLNLDE
jgi:hypothetical protein